MKIERFLIKACCGKTSLILKTDRPIDKSFITFLTNKGFSERTHFTVAGILYVENSDLIITGPMGADKLQIKCKKDNCKELLNNFELLLVQLE
jgi:hypothetical protein